MAWILLKSVGDDSEYIYSYIPGSEGHPYRIAVELVRKIKAAFTDRDAAQADLAAALAERARYGDMMSAALGQCENERDAARVLVVALTEETVTWREQRDAARAEAAELRDRLNATRAELRKVSDQGVSARLDRAEARADAIVLREQVAWMRSVAQDALDNDTDRVSREDCHRAAMSLDGARVERQAQEHEDDAKS